MSFSFSISPSNEYSGLISFRTDWFDFLAAQGTLESLLQNHSSKASVLRCSAFIKVQLSHPYMTTGKTVSLTRWIFVSKVMSLLFNILSKLVLAFLPRTSLVAQLVKNPPAMRETWVGSLGWEDPLEKGKATHTSTLAWRISWTVYHGVAESDTTERVSFSACLNTEACASKNAQLTVKLKTVNLLLSSFY